MEENNKGLQLPEASDQYDIGVFNNNFTYLDNKIDEVDEVVKDNVQHINQLTEQIDKVDELLEANINVNQMHDETITAHNEVVHLNQNLQSKQNQIIDMLDSYKTQADEIHVQVLDNQEIERNIREYMEEAQSAFRELNTNTQSLVDDTSSNVNQILSNARTTVNDLVNSATSNINNAISDNFNAANKAHLILHDDIESAKAQHSIIDSDIRSAKNDAIDEIDKRLFNGTNTFDNHVNAKIDESIEQIDNYVNEFHGDLSNISEAVDTINTAVDNLNATESNIKKNIDTYVSEKTNALQADVPNTEITIDEDITDESITKTNTVKSWLTVFVTQIINIKQSITDILASLKVASTSNAGFMPALSNKSLQFLNGSGGWSIPILNSLYGKLDATKLNGTIPIANLPQGALDRQINVANKAARLALKKSDIQNGDTVQEDDTELMYRVIDETMLGTETPEKAFKEYTAGRATYASESGMVNGHTVNADVPQGAVFTDHRTSFYGTCDTNGSEQNKIVTLVDGDDFELRAGVRIGIKFKNSNTFNATTTNHVTLNVNGTGAKSIYWANTSTPTGSSNIIHGVANYVHYYMYNGEQWVWDGWSKDNNTTYNRVTTSSDGLCPALPPETSQGGQHRQILCGDGAWDRIDILIANSEPVRMMQSTFQDGVDAVYEACVAEGVTPEASTPIAIAQAISQIRQDGDAVASDILSGKTAYSGKTLIEGTMVNKGEITLNTTSASGKAVLSTAAGYYTKITVDQTAAYNKGSADGKSAQYTECYNSWYTPRYNSGFSDGHSAGYAEGVNAKRATDSQHCENSRTDIYSQALKIQDLAESKGSYSTIKSCAKKIANQYNSLFNAIGS